MNLYTKELSPNLWADFEKYFDFGGLSSGCWCMNHRLPIGLNFEGEAARLAMQQLVETGRVFGVLAYCDNDPIPVGWCSLDRRKTLPGHDCIDKLASKLKAELVEAYSEPESESGKKFNTWNVFNGFESHFSRFGFEIIPRDFGEHGKFYKPMQLKI
ncbi:MAG: hypothetical protein KBD78_06870 [Oligoflexales bacterium]|nr:hypothetical protein [Oligoflexales bacterium]